MLPHLCLFCGRTDLSTGNIFDTNIMTGASDDPLQDRKSVIIDIACLKFVMYFRFGLTALFLVGYLKCCFKHAVEFHGKQLCIFYRLKPTVYGSMDLIQKPIPLANSWDHWVWAATSKNNLAQSVRMNILTGYQQTFSMLTLVAADSAGLILWKVGSSTNGLISSR